MCTVTIVPLSPARRPPDRSPSGNRAHPERFRLACNRDELRSRPAALPPVVRDFGRRKAIMPVDPLSGGTWIAANNAGLAATLLNVNLAQDHVDTDNPPKLSRGILIPRLMACATLADAERLGAATDPRQYPPFRLLLLDDRNICHFWSDGRSLRCERDALGDQPHLFTSSGLGDALVEGPRRELFDKMFTPDTDWQVQQDAFHRHSWPDRPHLSVCMERDKARTVSHTVIEIGPQRIALTYVPDAPDRAQPLLPIALPRSGAGE